MLVRFCAENFLSIRDAAEVSLVASSLQELRSTLLPSRYAKYGMLPVVAFYGANASGKSNFLAAIAFMRSMVVNSFKVGDAGSEIPVKPFLLDDENQQKPSTFVLDFILNDTRYQLGFSLGRQRVIQEWLYAFPKRTRQVLYHRNSDAPDEFYFGRTLGGSNRQIQSITRPNSLFISVAAASAHPLLVKIWDYFKDCLVMKLSPGASSNSYLAQKLANDDSLLTEAAKYLSMADTGITDVRITDTPIPDATKTQLTELYQVLGKLTGDKLKSEAPDVDRKIQLGHSGRGQTIKYFDFEDESLGTKYLFSLLPSLLSALKDGKVLVLDEITTSLHTHLAQRLVTLFTNKESNPNGAQLLFSTHDTNLLSPGLLRRDEVWLTEKSSEGATTVSALSDYKTKITDNIERGYLQGRFGAVPYLLGHWE
jgi:uncharacterized protein